MLRALAALVVIGIAAQAEPRPAVGSSEVRRTLARLRTLGSVLMVAAHPDDENTALLAYFAKGRHMRTGYLSLTRGEGGQNLIGAEQGELMGLIRTQELLMARRVDGAQQFFTRAIDFGFSKSADEARAMWGGEQVLSDVVWTIRRFQPDVIVLRFSGTSRDGHGQHQLSAMLGKEAFDAAADPAKFPEQLKIAAPWRAKRLLYNMPGFTPEMQKAAEAAKDKVTLDLGEYDPLSGYSYGEIAGMSRSLHKSQAMGSAERKGETRDYVRVIGGEAMTSDVFDGIDTTWARAGGAAVDQALVQAEQAFDARRPEAVVPALVEARRRMVALRGPWVDIKRGEIDEAIAQAAGIWLDGLADRSVVSPGTSVNVRHTVLMRSRGVEAKLLGIDGVGAEAALSYNQPVTRDAKVAIDTGRGYSQPVWLTRPPNGAMYAVADPRLIGMAEGEPVVTARFRLRVAGQEIELARPVVYRTVDATRGELVRNLVVAPAVAVEFAERTLVFPSRTARDITVQVRANQARAEGALTLEPPAGWSVAPPSQTFALKDAGEVASLRFKVSPPESDSTAQLKAVARLGATEVRHGMRVVDYDHIPPQTVFPDAAAKVVRVDARVLAHNVGYVMGAGDDVPQALRQLGCEVTLLSADDLAGGDLARFDAIVAGVRAYNTRRDLRANQQRLLDYVSDGGTLVVQYNTAPSNFFRGREQVSLDRIGPYPIKLSSGRVSVEEAPMGAVNPDHRLLQAPNHIEPRDYDGWVQERGLYFASEWDPKYEPIWEIADPGEKPQRGGTLFATHGQGVYVFTPLAWFRQLPAGVPGAYRLFANIISAGKVGGKTK